MQTKSQAASIWMQGKFLGAIKISCLAIIFSMPLVFWLLGVHWKAPSTFSIWHSQLGVNLESGEELECLRRR